MGYGRKRRPTLHPIPVERPFQVMGVDIMELPATNKENHYCDGVVECLNRTLNAELWKHVAKFGPQWDEFLFGMLWAYRNTLHESTKKKPSFLLYGINVQSPTEAAVLPAQPLTPTDVLDYREQLTLSLPSACHLQWKASRPAYDMAVQGAVTESLNTLDNSTNSGQSHYFGLPMAVGRAHVRRLEKG
ncbi:hypothetical protein EMCRGX_G016302 [Ephydatia muelleri]